MIASYIGGGATVAENQDLDGVDAVLTTGSSFTGIIDPTAPTTTTLAGKARVDDANVLSITKSDGSVVKVR